MEAVKERKKKDKRKSSKASQVHVEPEKSNNAIAIPIPCFPPPNTKIIPPVSIPDLDDVPITCSNEEEDPPILLGSVPSTSNFESSFEFADAEASEFTGINQKEDEDHDFDNGAIVVSKANGIKHREETPVDIQCQTTNGHFDLEQDEETLTPTPTGNEFQFELQQEQEESNQSECNNESKSTTIYPQLESSEEIKSNQNEVTEVPRPREASPSPAEEDEVPIAIAPEPEVSCSSGTIEETKIPLNRSASEPEVHAQPTLYPTIDPLSLSISTEYAEIEPCEEAISIEASAPIPQPHTQGEDSMEFYSFLSMKTTLGQVQLSKTREMNPIPEAMTVSFSKIQELSNHRPTISHYVKSLYQNYLLENNHEYIKQFLDSIPSSYEKFELFELMNNYLRAYNHLTGSEKSLSTLKDNCDDFEKHVWNLSIQQLSESTTCEDGNSVTATYKVHTAEFNQPKFSQLVRTLKDIKELLKDSFSLYTYSVQLSKIQINHFFYKSFGSFNLQSFEVQSYTSGYPTGDLRSYASLLKLSLSTLFHFLRKPTHLLHQGFIRDVQDWTEKCAGLLLRIATIEDHMFLLNHIIRLPPKIVTKFGSKLIQIPIIPIPLRASDYGGTFGHLHLDYALNVLATILSPVAKRGELLKQFKVVHAQKAEVGPGMGSSAPGSDSWVLVDSDGEDDHDNSTPNEEPSMFKESDIIALLQQVPFSSLFRRILMVCNSFAEDVHDLRFCTEQNLLKLLAFSSHLMDILGVGLMTYASDRYKQLIKLLGRLILQTVQYVSYQIENYMETHGIQLSMMNSVPTEYDAFVLQAISILLPVPELLDGQTYGGTLQFLVAIPFHLIGYEMLWNIYFKLTKTNICDLSSTTRVEISKEFEEELLRYGESNVFYILTVMSNMGMARDNEMEFVKLVTLQLFQIGFVNNKTRENCSKNTRDLLGNLTGKYPQLISILLHAVKVNIVSVDKMGLYLLRELSLNTWTPTEADINLLSTWLLNFNSYSLENQLSRFILQSLNWDFNENGELFLDFELHFQVALLIVQSHSKWEGSSPQNMISEGVKQLSAWVTQNPDFSHWSWEMVKKLHLHGFDRSNLNSSELRMTRILQELPKFECYSQLEPLKKATDDKNPIACFVTIMMTDYGHSLPVLCSNGLDLIEILLQNSKFEAVINILFFTIPIFASSKDSALSCKKLKSVISTLLSADMTYVRMAKNLITTEFPGLYTKFFGDMIQTQLQNCERFLSTHKRLISLWTELLTKIDNWNKDENILYLLDILARFSYARSECSSWFHNYFYTLYKEIPVQTSSGLTSLFFNWSTVVPTFLPNQSYPKMPYLLYFILSIEGNLEEHTGFWKSLCLNLANPKISLENAIKRSSSSTKYSTTTAYLSIYRWAQEALELPESHPLLFAYWHQFFRKYFHRAGANETFRGGIGERFFDGLVNTTFLKKIKKKLHEVLEYYQKNISKLSTGEYGELNFSSGENVEFILNTMKKYMELANAMTLWIEDPQYHKDSLYLPALPPQCLPGLMLKLVEGDSTDWTDYIDYDGILATERSSAKTYLSTLTRLSWIDPIKIPQSPRWYSNISTRRDEFYKRLNSYDAPLEPPPVPNFVQLLPTPTPGMYMDSSMLDKGLESYLKCLVEYAQKFTVDISKHTALDCAYAENLPDLYSTVESQALVNVRCGSSKIKTCSGAGHVLFKFSEARLNERIGHFVHQNRTDYHMLVSAVTQPPQITVCVSAVFMEDFITNLILSHRSAPKNSPEYQKIHEIGTKLFYKVANHITEDTIFYPPTRQLFSSFIEVIGDEFIGTEPQECQKLIQLCLRQSHLIGTLAPHMNLSNMNPELLIQNYSYIVSISKRNGDLTFVILSKLDLPNWLRKHKPKLIQRSELITLIWKALANSSQDERERPSQMVNETYRSHLKTMLLYDFPQHYGEVLSLLLEGSEKQVVPLELWFDFFNSLSRDKIVFSIEMDPFLRKRELKRFSIEVNILRHQELVETAQLLANHFTKERLAYGIYGLYPKYRTYIEPLSCFIQLISYAMIASALKNSKGVISQQVVDSVWPLIRELYSPWILPYSQKVIQQNGAAWIQQMNFESSSVLQPWVPTDTNLASIFMNDFTDSVLFLSETLPGCPLLYSYLWNFYAENYANSTVKEHVLNVVNNCYISIPWSMFWPSSSDMELMNKTIETYLPSCHSLLGVIFVQVNWGPWIQQLVNTSSSVRSRIHAILLNLTVHLSTDIVARESPTWISFMNTVHTLNWKPVLPSSLEPIFNWYVMSVDPRVVLVLENLHALDLASFQLLRIVSGYGSNGHLMNESGSNSHAQSSPNLSISNTFRIDLNRKRYLYVRTYVRLIVSASSKYKNLLQTNGKNFEKSLHTLLDDIVNVVKTENQSREDFSSNLKEMFSLVSNHYLGTISRNGIIGWLDLNKDLPLCFLYELVYIAYTTKVQAYIIVPLIEATINLTFRHKEASWNTITELTIVPEQTDMTQFLDVSSKDGHFLVLYSLLLRKYNHLCNGGMSSVTILTSVLKNMKPKEANESALPLIYGLFIKICIHLLQEAVKVPGANLEKCVKKFLTGFSLHLNTVGDDKQGWAVFGVFGLTRASQLSVRGRLFAKCLYVFLLVQMPSNSSIRVSPAPSPSPILESSSGSTASSDYNYKLPHGNELEKLEELKLNRLYTELIEIIDWALNFIRDPSHSLSSYEIFISQLTCQLFTADSYLLNNLCSNSSSNKL